MVKESPVKWIPSVSPQRCEGYWRLWDRMIRASEKLALERYRDAGGKEIQKAEEEKRDRVLELGYHFEFCKVCKAWWRSFGEEVNQSTSQ